MKSLSEEYEQNFQHWIEQHIALLKSRKFEELDIKHLVEELEDMGKSNLRELESRFIILIAHLLKWQFQFSTLSNQWQEFEGKSWRKTIIEQRIQISFLLKKIPSLRAKLKEAVIESYPEAVELTVKETQLPIHTFPQECPYSVQQLLEDDFYPNME